MCFGLGIIPSPSIPPLQAQPAPPKKSDPAVEEAAAKERALARLRKGRASTILTDFTGITDTSGKKTLLGS